MKKIRDTIERHLLCADRKWKALPAQRQKFFTKMFFAGYATITVLVIISICISTGNRSNTLLIDHISSVSKLEAVKKVTSDNRVSSQSKKQTDERSR